MVVLSIDIETYSPVDLSSAGVYKYSEHPDFQVLLFAYKLNTDDVKVVDCVNGRIPDRILEMLQNPAVLKTAYNASFERICLSRMLDLPKYTYLNPGQWDCTKVRASRIGWPMNLGATAKAMGLAELKSDTGKKLIEYFSIPVDPKKNEGRTRNLPQHAPDKWIEFMKYCGQDVIVETGIRNRVISAPVSDFEQRLWELDQRINDWGMKLNLDLVKKAQAMIDEYIPRLVTELQTLTKLENPNSDKQMKEWLLRQGETLPTKINPKGVKVTTLAAEFIEDMLNGDDLSPISRQVLELRQSIKKTSLGKYQAMIDCVCADGRVRGAIEFNGASRTGRWAGRLFQPHNLPTILLEADKKKGFDDLLAARAILDLGDIDLLELSYNDVIGTLSQLIRTMIEAEKGSRFMPVDFSAIEARVIAWLAGEEWRLEVFRTHGKIYEASASRMFKVPLESIGKGSPLRKRGKVAELALGYQGSKGALVKMGALKMGILNKELIPIVRAWRKENPAIVQLWRTMEDLMLKAIMNPTKRYAAKRITMFMQDGTLNVVLPSGRPLCYINARTVNILYFKKLTKDKDILAAFAEDPETEIYEYQSKTGRKLPFMVGEDAPEEKWVTHIVYDGLGDDAQWRTQDTYGGKIVENCLSGDTQVLTNYGWVRITEVRKDSLLWDGIEWVNHNGSIRKGVQNTISIDGVRLTEDHLILTKNGWKYASQSEGLNRHEDTFLNSDTVLRFNGGEIYMVDQMRLREGNRIGRNRVSKKETIQLWMQKKRVNRGQKFVTREKQTQNVSRMAVNEMSMHKSNSPSVEELRRSRNHGVRKMDGGIQILLGGYARYLRRGSYTGKSQRKRRILQRKLYLGQLRKTGAKPKEQYRNRHSLGTNYSRRGFGAVRDKCNDFTLSTCEQLPDRTFIRGSGFFEPVYDIMNAGPRHRFIVKSESGQPFIVHNCVQGIARDCLAEAMMNLDESGYSIVLHVHDEAVPEMPYGHGSTKHIDEIMATPPAWASDMPLKAESYETEFFRKD